VHVAGTNGKGSVSAMVEAIAREAGKKTGLFTSPHLCRFAERIRVAGEPIEDAVLAPLLERVLAGAPELSFFESATLAAFLAFREAGVEIAIVEVGIGGRLDATNVVPTPRAAAITRIALDHTDRLGPTLLDIAREKAGIAKPGLDIVLGPVAADVREVIDAVAHANGATTTSAAGAPIPARIGLAGDYQRENAQVAALLGARIGAPPSAVERGIAGVRWPGRLESIPGGGLAKGYLIDAAHNPDGAEGLARYLAAHAVPERTAIVFGTLADKDWASMLDLLAPLARSRVYVAPQGGARGGVDPARLVARHAGRVAGSLPEAIQLAAAGDGAVSGVPDRVVIAGSLALVGEARALLLGLPRDPPVAL
jgi:dihydrofolate synthase/folylpolyglutamate synthase